MLNFSVRRFLELLSLLNGIPFQIALCFKGRNTLYLLSVEHRRPYHFGLSESLAFLDRFSLTLQFWLAIFPESYPFLFPNPVLNLGRFLTPFHLPSVTLRLLVRHPARISKIRRHQCNDVDAAITVPCRRVVGTKHLAICPRPLPRRRSIFKLRD